MCCNFHHIVPLLFSWNFISLHSLQTLTFPFDKKCFYSSPVPPPAVECQSNQGLQLCSASSPCAFINVRVYEAVLVTVLTHTLLFLFI